MMKGVRAGIIKMMFIATLIVVWLLCSEGVLWIQI